MIEKCGANKSGFLECSIFVCAAATEKHALGDLERFGRKYAQIQWAVLADLVPMTLFNTDGIEALNEKFGGKVVTLASAKCSAEWAMRRDYLSLCPTTKWKDYVLADCDLAEHNL